MKLKALVTNGGDYQSGYFDAPALGLWDTQSTVTQGVAGSLQFADNKQVVLAANTPSGGISKLLRFNSATDYDRSWMAWYDKDARIHVAAGWHRIDIISGADHNAYEIKTSADQAGPNPADMRTRFSVGTDAQQVLASFPQCTYVETGPGEAYIDTAFGYRLRGYLADGSVHGVMAQFVAQSDSSDNVTGSIDVAPVTAGAAKGVTLQFFRNTNTGSASNPVIAVKKGDGTNTNMLVFTAKTGTMALTPASGSQAVTLVGSGAVSASTSTGGLINLNNTSSTGAGLVVYSNAGVGTTGRLGVFRADNAAFATQCLYIENHGNSHAVSINHQPGPTDGQPTNGNALAVTSLNPNDTTLGVSGAESGRGTIKVTHNKPDGVADTNASAISINLDRINAGETSAAQGIFMDSTHAMTSNLLNLRSNGSSVLSLTPSLLTVVPNARFNGQIGFNNTAPIAKPTVTGAKGSNAALGSLLTALANYGLVTDSTTA